MCKKIWKAIKDENMDFSHHVKSRLEKKPVRDKKTFLLDLISRSYFKQAPQLKQSAPSKSAVVFTST